MSTENITKDSINLRLLAVVQHCTHGNVKKFAEKADINPVTMLYYTKGRLPGTNALINICELWNVNINWLLTGKGPMFIGGKEESKPDESKPAMLETEELPLVIKQFHEWIRELCSTDPGREVWLSFELQDKIELFQEWMRKKREKETDSKHHP